MDQPQLGKLIVGEAHRDAIHIAIAPVIAKHALAPGQHVGFVEIGKVGAHAAKMIGIVDPFLKQMVNPEEAFYVFLYPNTITALRHEWTHPEFNNKPLVQPAKDRVAESREWIEAYGKGLGLGADELISAASDKIDNGEYLCKGGRFESVRTPEEFWKHYEVVTGRKVSDHSENFFTCACS